MENPNVNPSHNNNNLPSLPQTIDSLPSAPFHSYPALVDYYHHLAHTAQQDDRLKEALAQTHHFLMALPSRINAETNEIAGVTHLIQCDDKAISEAVLNHLRTELARVKGHYPLLYRVIDDIARTLPYATYSIEPLHLVAFLQTFLNEVQGELAVMGKTHAETSLLALQAGTHLVECLLMSGVGALGYDYLENKLKAPLTLLNENLEKYRTTEALHAFWGLALDQSLGCMTHQLNVQEEAFFKQQMALQIVKGFGAGGKGAIYMGLGTASLALAIAGSATVGAFHMLPEAFLSFGRGVFELLKSGYNMKKFLQEARSTWQLLHPERGEVSAEVAKREDLVQQAEQDKAQLWQTLNTRLSTLSLEEIAKLDAFTQQWWAYSLTELLLTYEAPNNVVLPLQAALLNIYRIQTTTPDVQQLMLIQCERLAKKYANIPAPTLATYASLIWGYVPRDVDLEYYHKYQQKTLTKKERKLFEKDILSRYSKQLQGYVQLQQNLAAIEQYRFAPPLPPTLKADTSTLRTAWFEAFSQDKALYDLALSYQHKVNHDELDEKAKAALYNQFTKIGRDKHAENLSPWGEKCYQQLKPIIEPWEKEMKKQQHQTWEQQEALMVARLIEVKNKITAIQDKIKFSAGLGNEATQAQLAILMNRIKIEEIKREKGIKFRPLISADTITANDMETIEVSIEAINQIEKDIPTELLAAVPTPVNPGQIHGHFAPPPSSALSNSNAVEGIRYRKGEEDIVHHYVELDFDDLSLGREKSNQLRQFVKEQIEDIDGYMENSHHVNEAGIVSAAFSRERAAKSFLAKLQQKVLQLQAAPSSVPLPQ